MTLLRRILTWTALPVIASGLASAGSGSLQSDFVGPTTNASYALDLKLLTTADTTTAATATGLAGLPGFSVEGTSIANYIGMGPVWLTGSTQGPQSNFHLAGLPETSGTTTMVLLGGALLGVGSLGKHSRNR
jgi:hypothetical protein